MVCISRRFRRAAGLGLLLPGLTLAARVNAQNLPTADEILQRAMHRSEAATGREPHPIYRYNKHTVVEEMDAKGQLKDRKERLYDVRVESGFSYLTLVQVNGQDISTAELKKQADKELAERQKLSDAKPGGQGDERENFLTPELIGKYKFLLLGSTNLNDRPAYVLSFAPAGTNLAVHKLTDRFLNHIAGTLCLDASEYEIVRLDLHLTGEVVLWAGLIGTLRQCNYTLERTRLPDGAWFALNSRGTFEGRKLIEPMVIKSRSDSSHFRRVDLAER